MLASWPMDDFQWWQIQDPDMDPAAAAAITGLVPSIPADQQLLNNQETALSTVTNRTLDS